MSANSFEFRAEVKELLNLVINSLYSHKEIFLRELISNASDAIDKAKYMTLTDSTLKEPSDGWKIKIKPDIDNKILIISDNGIGMSKDELIDNLGTIAKSGTKEFIDTIKKVKETGDISLIGQFGVGFYSAFMVSDKIDVISRRIDDDRAYKWSSKGHGVFYVEEAEKDYHGTNIILHIKDDDKDYLEEFKIIEIIKKYSDFISYPIVLVKKDGKEETINSMQALWLKSKSEIKPDEHNQFYKHIAHDFSDPLEVIHYKAEGTNEFTALLFIPEKKPFDIYYKSGKFGPSLYINKVQIMDHCEELVPQYLRFIKGVVDAADLPLNVSREMLQNNRQITQINKNITKKVLDTLKNLKKNDRKKYEKFFEQFGDVLKEGLHIDFERKEEIASLIIFNTLKYKDEKIDLDRYIENMKENQEEIYFVTGKNINELENIPQLEYFRNKDIDVIFFTGEFDDILINSLYEYNKKRLKSILKGDLKIDDTTKQELEEKSKEYKTLLDFMKEYLKDHVNDVRGGIRLTDSIACLVGDEFDLDENMRRLFESIGQSVPQSKKILEINLDHPVISKMKALFEVDQKSSRLKDYTEMVYNLALISNGQTPKDINRFSKLITELMATGI